MYLGDSLTSTSFPRKRVGEALPLRIRCVTAPMDAEKVFSLCVCAKVCKTLHDLRADRIVNTERTLGERRRQTGILVIHSFILVCMYVW